MRGLGDDDQEVCTNAAACLRTIGPKAAGATPALVKILASDRLLELRQDAALALGDIGPEAKKGVPALAKLVGDASEDLSLRRYAAHSLGFIGPDARAATPALVEALLNPDKELRECAALSLGRIGPGASAAIPGLCSALKDADDEARRAAAWALGQIGAAAIPEVVDRLAHANPDVRFLAALALAHMGPTAEKTVPALVNSLNDKDARVRRYAAVALRMIGRAAKVAVPALERLLQDKDEAVRRAAAEALAQIRGKPASPPAAPALESGHFTVGVEQDGRALKATDGCITIEKKPFTVVVRFGKSDMVLLNASFAPASYQAMRAGEPVHRVKGFSNTGMADYVFNPQQDVIICDDAPNCWYYHGSQDHRFDSGRQEGKWLVCRRRVASFLLLDEGRRRVPVAEAEAGVLYLCFMAGGWRGDRQVARQTGFLKLAFRKGEAKPE